MMKSPSSILLCALLVAVVKFPSVTEAFVPARVNFQSPRASHLLVSTSASTSSTSVDSPFDEYSQTDPDQGLAYKDTMMGAGDVAETGKVLTVAYKGRMMSNNVQFTEAEKFPFKVGQGAVMPGWEKGVIGMRVGGKRTIRIPPKLAFGDRWVKNTVPPNSHVEFDLELKSSAQNPLEERWVLLNWGPGRIAGFLVMLGIFAITPLL